MTQSSTRLNTCAAKGPVQVGTCAHNSERLCAVVQQSIVVHRAFQQS